MTDEPAHLSGGVVNAGRVVREGSFVLRPSSVATPLVQLFPGHLHDRGFHACPELAGVDADGRERFGYAEGAVAVPPFPAWSASDRALRGIAALLRRFHEASADFSPPEGAAWSNELADPAGGGHFCHNDVCPENVVWRDGSPVALLDFDFVAPGRPEYDLAQLAKMWVPIGAPEDAVGDGRGGLDPFARLRLVVDAYGPTCDRHVFLDVLDEAIAVGDAFVERRVAKGHDAFAAAWRRGGAERAARRRSWFDAHREELASALAQR